MKEFLRILRSIPFIFSLIILCPLPATAQKGESQAVSRVIKNNGFFEWYTIEGKPNGSGVFRGFASVMMEAIEALRVWAESNQD